MIENVQIKKVGSFGEAPENLTGLSQFNFFYGGNGTGKTTISRVIAEENRFPDCKVVWKSGTKLEVLAYNRDFFDRNFGVNTDLKGIFTLGEKDKTTMEAIAAAKKELDDIGTEITTLTTTLKGEDGKGGKNSELETLENDFKEQCWVLKQKHDAKFQGPFSGLRGDKRLFKERILKESTTTTNQAEVKQLADLEKRADSLFGETPERLTLIPDVSFDKLVAFELDQILEKKIIGKSDVDIAAMILKLGNSDWVKEGKIYYEVNGGFCPFCQQTTEESLSKSLNEYFDEQFEKTPKQSRDYGPIIKLRASVCS